MSKVLEFLAPELREQTALAARYVANRSADAAPLIRLSALEKAYRTPAGDVPALRGIDLEIYAGEFVALTGRSGAGKSTLINLVTGIDRPTAGEIWIAGQPIHSLSESKLTRWRGREVGVIFQSFQLMPMLTCVQNVMLPMDFADLYNSERQRSARALALLEAVEILEHAHKLPGAVSGGQRQRVAIARALANEPQFLAADEPTGSLDSVTAEAVLLLFERLVAAGTTIIMATHDPELAAQATRIVQLEDGKFVRHDPVV